MFSGGLASLTSRRNCSLAHRKRQPLTVTVGRYDVPKHHHSAMESPVCAQSPCVLSHRGTVSFRAVRLAEPGAAINSMRLCATGGAQDCVHDALCGVPSHPEDV